MTPIFRKIAVVGVGLIGGSFGMAARKLGIASEVIGIGRNPAKLEKALRLSAIDTWTTDLGSGISDADLVYIATPVGNIIEFLKESAHLLKPGCLITDAGSSKYEICAAADECVPSGVFFVGGHPMAGSEAAGVDAARSDLFQNAVYVLTPNGNTNRSMMQQFGAIVEMLGSRVIVMPPDSHDRCVSVISHLPHIIAAALVDMAESYSKENPLIYELIAGSFKDMTRVAGSSPELWGDICATNSANISDAASVFKRFLDEGVSLAENKGSDAFEQWFAEAKHIRETHISRR